MNNLIKVVALGVAILVTDNSFSQTNYCDAPAIANCFNTNNYVTPVEITDTPDLTCKTWSTGTFNCSGTYHMAGYPPVGKTPTKLTFNSTCSGDVAVEVQTGEQIENILNTFSETQLNQLSADEIREGKTPVFLKVYFPQGGQGDATVNIYCDAYDNEDTPPPPTGPTAIDFVYFLLFGATKK